MAMNGECNDTVVGSVKYPFKAHVLGVGSSDEDKRVLSLSICCHA